MTGPALSYADFQQDLSPEAFAHTQGPSATQRMVRQAIKTPEGKARLEQSNADLKAADEPSARDYLRDVGETAETVAEGFPGGGLAMTGMRALGNGGDVEKARREINAETSDAGLASVAGQALGTAAAFAIPGVSALTPAQAGGAVGAASGLLSNEPEGFSPKERIIRAIVGGAGGAIAGKSAEMLGKQVQAILAERRVNPDVLARQIRRMDILPASETGVATDAPRSIQVPVVKQDMTPSGFSPNRPPATPGPKPEIPPRPSFRDIANFEIVPPEAAPKLATFAEAASRPANPRMVPDEEFNSVVLPILEKLRAAQGVGETYGDAEIAQGIDKIKGQDLTDLMRQSVDQLQRGRTMEELARINRPPR